MSDFIKELEEDIKEEELHKLWKKYGKYVVSAAVGIVVVAAAVPTYKNYQHSQSLKSAAIYKQALRYVEKERADKALPLLDEIIDTGSGYGKLAELQKAALLTEVSMGQGKITLMDEVQNIYKSLAVKNRKDPSLSGLATILEAYRAVSMGEGDKWKRQVEPLTAPGQPWRAMALEVLALDDMKRGRLAEAAQRFMAVLQDNAATHSARRRALLMLSAMNVQTVNLPAAQK